MCPPGSPPAGAPPLPAPPPEPAVATPDATRAVRSWQASASRGERPPPSQRSALGGKEGSSTFCHKPHAPPFVQPHEVP
eukprot:2786216-Prymnesium_polylepis.2